MIGNRNLLKKRPKEKHLLYSPIYNLETSSVLCFIVILEAERELVSSIWL